jgi:hypothetical protein
MDIDPKQIARMISEDPNEVPSNPDFSHFDDTEDEYVDEDTLARNEMRNSGDIATKYLNANKRTPEDFVDWQNIQVGSSVDMVWSAEDDYGAPPGHFQYYHPVFYDFVGFVYFDDGVWKHKLTDQAAQRAGGDYSSWEELIDPKKIARMISEDPDEVAPSNHFDDTEDEYGSALSAWTMNIRQDLNNRPQVEYETHKPTDGELNNLCYLSMRYIANWSMRNVDFSVVKMMGGDPPTVEALSDQFIPNLAEYVWDHIMGEPADPTIEDMTRAVEALRDMLYEMDTQTRNATDATAE